MRVISGQKRGKKLEVLIGDAVRPTTDKVKESVFNIIQFELASVKFLDLFAGSGQIGLEALSRGASSATFVDKCKRSIDVVRRNLDETGFLNQSNVVNLDALLFLKKANSKFNIAFLDPPYNSSLLDETLFCVPNVMEQNGIIICEHPFEKILPDNFAGFSLKKIYKYGKIAVSLYRHNNLIR